MVRIGGNWTIDTSDMVYVSDYCNHRVSVFTQEGQFVTSFGGRGGEPGSFQFPVGLAIDNCRVVYVCDYGNHQIQMC